MNNIEILLAEDNPSDAELIIREFKKQNMSHNLHHVTDGEEALEFLFATGKYAGRRDVLASPKMILLDIQMPKVNGMEVLHAVKQDQRTKMIPVVILTSSKEHPDIAKCYALGANSYIVKPVNFEDLSSAINRIGHYWLALNQPAIGKL